MYFGEVNTFITGIMLGLFFAFLYSDGSRRGRVKSAVRASRDGLPGIAEAKMDFLREKSFTMLTRLQGIIGITETLLATHKHDIDTKDLKILSEGARQIHSLLTEGLSLHDNAPEIKTIEATSVVPTKNRRVLLVEDDESMRLTCGEMLKALNLEIDVAVNGKECLEKMKIQNYGLVIMDCEMPIMDGYEATLAIRKMKDKKDTNILGFTANALRTAVDKCLAVGMNSCLSKPVHLHELKAAVNKFIIDS